MAPIARPPRLLTAQQADLVEDHLGLVRYVMRTKFHLYRGNDYDDIHQDGCLGLIRAAQNFDPDLGAPFKVWATMVIRRAILDGMRTRKSGGRSKNWTGRPLSLDVVTEDGLSLGDRVADPQAQDFERRFGDIALARELLAVIDQLPPAEAQALRSACVPGGQRRLAEELGVTEGRISQVVRLARTHLRRIGAT